jgi:hypothetical protein
LVAAVAPWIAGVHGGCMHLHRGVNYREALQMKIYSMTNTYSLGIHSCGDV